MGDYGFESEMLFVSGKGKNREFLIKTRSTPEHEDEFLYFTSSRNEIHSIQATHWRYVLDPKAGGETHFAQLHADVAIPGQGPGQIKLDVVRTPATDVGFWLLRKTNLRRDSGKRMIRILADFGSARIPPPVTKLAVLFSRSQTERGTLPAPVLKLEPSL